MLLVTCVLNGCSVVPPLVSTSFCCGCSPQKVEEVKIICKSLAVKRAHRRVPRRRKKRDSKGSGITTEWKNERTLGDVDWIFQLHQQQQQQDFSSFRTLLSLVYLISPPPSPLLVLFGHQQQPQQHFKMNFQWSRKLKTPTKSNIQPSL